MLSYWAYIKLEFFISLWCAGLFIAAKEGNLLYRIKVFLSAIAFRIALVFTCKPKRPTAKENREEIRIRNAFALRDEIMKPIISCPDCMASVHSAIIYITYKLVFHISFDWIDILVWLSLAVPAVFLNVLLYAVVTYLLEYVKALKKEDETD